MWGFGYDKTKGETIGECLSVGYRVRPYKFVAKYNGIDYRFVDINNYELKEIYHFLRECKIKNNIPVIVMDGINCTWTKFYNKTSIQHYAIVNGMDSNGLVCIDPFSSSSLSEIYDYNRLLSSKHRFVLFEKCNIKEKVNINEVLETLYNEVKDIQLDRLYQEFINDMRYERMKAEMPLIENAETFPLFISINLIALMRENTAAYFENMYTQTNETEFLEIKQLFLDSSQLWNKVKLVLLRFCILRTEKEVEIIRNCINQIRKREKKILEILSGMLF